MTGKTRTPVYKDMDSLPVNKLFVRYAAEFSKYVASYAGTLQRETAHHEKGETRHKMDVIEAIVS